MVFWRRLWIPSQQHLQFFTTLPSSYRFLAIAYSSTILPSLTFAPLSIWHLLELNAHCSSEPTMAPRPPTASHGATYYPPAVERQLVLYLQPAMGPSRPEQHQYNHTMQLPPFPYDQMMPYSQYCHRQVVNLQFASHSQYQPHQQSAHYAPSYQQHQAHSQYTNYSAPAP